MNASAKQELEKAGTDVVGLAKMPPAQQEAGGDLNEPVLDNQNTDVRTEERELAPLFLPDVEAGRGSGGEFSVCELKLHVSDSVANDARRPCCTGTRPLLYGSGSCAQGGSLVHRTLEGTPTRKVAPRIGKLQPKRT